MATTTVLPSMKITDFADTPPIAGNGTIESLEVVNLTGRDGVEYVKVNTTVAFPDRKVKTSNLFVAEFLKPEFKQVVPTLDEKQQKRYYAQKNLLVGLMSAAGIDDLANIEQVQGVTANFYITPQFNDQSRFELRSIRKARQ